jgi:hypothetical protein
MFEGSSLLDSYEVRISSYFLDLYVENIAYHAIEDCMEWCFIGPYHVLSPGFGPFLEDCSWDPVGYVPHCWIFVRMCCEYVEESGGMSEHTDRKDIDQISSRYQRFGGRDGLFDSSNIWVILILNLYSVYALGNALSSVTWASLRIMPLG